MHPLPIAPGLVQKPKAVEKIPFEVVETGQKSSIHLFRVVVIQSKADWDQLQSRHDPKGSSQSAAASMLDFEKNTVFGVFAGQKPNAAYKVQITGVTRSATGAKVSYRILEPKAGTAAAESMSQPFELIKTQKIPGAVSFQNE